MIKNLLKLKVNDDSPMHIESELPLCEKKEKKVDDLFFKDLTKEQLEYLKSSEYGKKIKVKILEKNLLKIDWSKLGSLIYRQRQIRESFFPKMVIAHMSVVLMIFVVGMAMRIISGRLGKEYEWMINFGFNMVDTGFWLLGLSIITMMLITVVINEKMKYETKDILKRKVKDIEGNVVRGIWYQYHNVRFKNEEEREQYLIEKYDDLNYELEASIHKTSDVEGDLEKYLKEWSKKEVLRWTYKKLVCW